MTVGSAVNDPKSGTLTAKTAPSEVNGPTDGTLTAQRWQRRGQGVFRRDLCQKGSARGIVQGAVPRQRHDDVCLTTLRARPQAGAVKGGG